MGAKDLTWNWNIINKRNSKQNITRDIAIKNMVTVATGHWDAIGGTVLYRSYYIGHNRNLKGRLEGSSEVGLARGGGANRR